MQYSLKPKHFIIRPSSIILLFTVLLISSCTDDSLPTEIPFYHYDFETDYTNIDSVYVSEFNGSKVLGPFNNSGFSIRVNELPEHKYVKLKFDLYIHDSWEGNTNEMQLEVPDHDAWFIEFDPHRKVKPSDKVLFETTFSNGLCVPSWCYSQSYPNQYPFEHPARNKAKPRNMYGRCLWASSEISTSIYTIEKFFLHEEKSVVIAFYDRLKEAGGSDVCNESWSMDNLSITVIN